MPHVHKLFNLTIINAVQSKRIPRNLAFLSINQLLVALPSIRIESKLCLISVYSSIMVPYKNSIIKQKHIYIFKTYDSILIALWIVQRYYISPWPYSNVAVQLIVCFWITHKIVYRTINLENVSWHVIFQARYLLSCRFNSWFDENNHRYALCENIPLDWMYIAT